MPASALIIDDDPGYAASLARLVRREGYEVEVAFSGEEALERIQEFQPDLVLVDMALPGMDGVEVLHHLREREPLAVCIVVSGHESVERAVASVQAGAFDYISKSSPLEEIRLKLSKALEVASLRQELKFYQERELERNAFQMIGESRVMREVFKQIDEIAATPDTTVLILGETGTGKELVARAIHDRSERRDRPLVSVNCTAIPDNLAESEFFGHERGAFTGADRLKRGLVETSEGGSLFLDEVGDLDQALQGKLLRVIEERRFTRVGGTRELSADVRFIAATNRDLVQMAAEGHFREDLLYRLNVYQIRLPALRERGRDCLLLAQHFVQQFNLQLNKQVKGLDESAEAFLRAHHLPGNVRQLRNLVEQAMIHCRGDWLTRRLFRASTSQNEPRDRRPPPAPPPAVRPAAKPVPRPPPAPTPSPTRGRIVRGTHSAVSLADQLSMLQVQQDLLWSQEQEIIRRALQEVGGNKSKAAEILNISRYALHRRLRRMSTSGAR
jgi:DNA-binding NtrC family response regulator